MAITIPKTRPLLGYVSLSDGARQAKISLQRFARATRLLGHQTYRVGNVILVADSVVKDITSAFKDGRIRRGRPPMKETVNKNRARQ